EGDGTVGAGRCIQRTSVIHRVYIAELEGAAVYEELRRAPCLHGVCKGVRVVVAFRVPECRNALDYRALKHYADPTTQIPRGKKCWCPLDSDCTIGIESA